MSPDKLYLAFDLSTQGLKAVVSNEALEVVCQEAISFDTDLREFGTTNGVHRNADGQTITSPTMMWVKAVDILLMKMMSDGVKFSDVCMVSGTAQQHGSVYWAHSAEITLSQLHYSSPLTDQLQNCFVVNDSPVWMDSSTTKQCGELEAAVYGAYELAEITGSKAYERFTGTQIAKVFQENKVLYYNCERISLVSSFLASLFVGLYAPIDYSDGSGMNLLNINTKTWEPKLLDACAPGLASRLGEPVPSSKIIGKVSQYMVERYRFSQDCSVVAFTGDNPASLAGMRLGDADVAVSLGTSDTMILWTEKAKPSIDGHIFINPIDEKEFMALLCFKNGSLAREAVCNRCSSGSWEKFNDALLRSPPGNGGQLGIYFYEMEILPHVKGVYRWNDVDEFVLSFDEDVEVRAVVEGQLLAKRYYAEKYGYVASSNSRILATGGASKNRQILQVLCDIFNCPVYTQKETSNSACLGCIYRCKHALAGDGKETFKEAIKDVAPHQLLCSPNPRNVNVYQALLQRYAKFESVVYEKNGIKPKPVPKPVPKPITKPEVTPSAKPAEVKKVEEVKKKAEKVENASTESESGVQNVDTSSNNGSSSPSQDGAQVIDGHSNGAMSSPPRKKDVHVVEDDANSNNAMSSPPQNCVQDIDGDSNSAMSSPPRKKNVHVVEDDANSNNAMSSPPRNFVKDIDGDSNSAMSSPPRKKNVHVVEGDANSNNAISSPPRDIDAMDTNSTTF